MARSFKLGSCWIYIDPEDGDGYTQVTFSADEGLYVEGRPQDTAQYRLTAQAAGYGSDWRRLNLEHDFYHVFVSVKLGMETSPTLYHTALHHAGKGMYLSKVAYEWEDSLALAMARYVNTGRVDPELGIFVWKGMDLVTLRAEVLMYLRGEV